VAADLAGGLGAVALFAVPGYGLTELMPTLRRQPLARRAAYGYLLGVAAVAGGLYALSHLRGVPLRPPAVWATAAAPALAGLAAGLWRRHRAKREPRSEARPSLPPVPTVPPAPVDATASAVLAVPATSGAPAALGTPTAPANPPVPALSAARGARSPSRRTAMPAWSLVATRCCALVAALICLGVFAEAATNPPQDWDGRMTWCTQARYIRAAGTVDAGVLLDERWYVSHPQYPLLLPIAQVAAQEAFGADPDAPLPRAVYAAFLPALLLVVYDATRRAAGRTAGAVAALAAAATPFLLLGEGGAESTYSDLPLACFYGAALVLLLGPRPRAESGLAAGMLLGAAVLTKNEGTPLACLALALGWRAARPAGAADAADRRSAWAGAWRFAAAAAPVVLALALLASWRAGIPNREDESYPDLVHGASLWPGIVTNAAAFVPVLVDKMNRFRHWAGLWWLAPAALLAGRRVLRHPRLRRYLAAAAGPPAIAWAAYSIHPHPAFLAAVTWERFLLQAAVPLITVLTCALAEVGRHLAATRRGLRSST
jgi:Dolichyl-phosphate-mannose-protein mannosyltransferase